MCEVWEEVSVWETAEGVLGLQKQNIPCELEDLGQCLSQCPFHRWGD